MSHRVRLVLFMALACVLGTAARSVFACDVPVYRYALERWEADDYTLVLFHRGGLSDEQRRLAAAIDERAQGNSAGRVNLALQAVDLATDPENPLAVCLRKEMTNALPLAVLLYPEAAAACAGSDCPPETRPVAVWSGPFTEPAIRSLLDSPLRRQLADRLLQGNAVVWVWVESAKGGDEAAIRKLQEELKKQERLLAPEAETRTRTDEASVRVTFPVLRLARSNPDEQALLRMLLRSEPDLETLGDRPMVFPVFGRGRALYALAGAGINPGTIAEACEFVTGACSCEVKAENPGTDLLMGPDWSHIADNLTIVTDDPPPPLTGLMPEAPVGKPAAAAPAVAAEPVKGGEAGSGGLLRNVAAALAGLVVVVLIAAGVMKIRR